MTQNWLVCMSNLVVAQITISDDRFWAGLGIDLVAIGVLAFVVYFRRHRRRDLLMAYVCFNVALFAVVTALTSVLPRERITGLALGLASWARCRSSACVAKS